MPELRPFRGWRYADAAQLRDLVCPPYDIISPEEQAALHKLNPHNAVRLELPVADTPDEPRARRYERAADLFSQWTTDGIVEHDATERFYVYRQDFVSPSGDRRHVTGIIGALRLERFGADSGVLPHERTMPGPIEDRLTLMRALPMNVSPIYGIYRGSGNLGPFMESLTNRPPAGRVADEQGSLHRLWVVDAPAEIEMLASALGDGPLVIADGHHRYETALAYREEQGGPGDHDAIMCFCVDADAGALEVLPYNRAIRSPGAGALAANLEAAFATKKLATGEGATALAASGADHPLLFVLPDGELLVEVSDEEVVAAVGDRAPAWRALDVVALHEIVLPQALPDGIDEITFSHDSADVTRGVQEGRFDVGVVLNPLKAAQVIEVAKSGERMPQKASYFWPKAVTGLVFRSLT